MEHRDANSRYEDGLRDGRLSALEAMLSRHGERLDGHAKRLHIQERLAYGLMGAIFLLELAPALQRFFNAE